MSDQQSLSFIRTSFRSVWAIEVLRFLVERRGEPHPAEELIHELRVSNSVVAQSLAQLGAARLVIVVAPEVVRYQPANAELDDLAQEALALYARRPDLVRRTIVSQTFPGITAFSDAFKLRKE